MQTVITVLVVGVLIVAACSFLAYLVQAFRADQIALAMRQTGITQNAARPADPPPAQPAVRAPNGECMCLDCHEPWEVLIHGWGVCRKHDPRAPYDQDITPESVIEAAREITRRAVA